MNDEVLELVAKNLNITYNQVKVVLDMISEGCTVPFIARYRKEKTNALDEEKIREIYKMWEYEESLKKRKEQVIRLIDEKGMLTDELRLSINNAKKLVDVEDLYRPYKEKRKTKATEAISLGLDPLADEMLKFPIKGSLDELLNKYVNDKVTTKEKALEGAKYIIAERISDNANYRKEIRFQINKNGILKTKIKKNASDEKNVYQMYYDYSEPLKWVKPHRVLAFNRGEDANILSVGIECDMNLIISYLEKMVIKNDKSFVVKDVKEAILDSLKRLIYPSVEREIRTELTLKAEDNAIEIFSVNLRNLLLQPPMKGKVVLGVDPAFRTGCKVAVVDPRGMVLKKDKIYQNQMFPGENVPKNRIDEAKKIVSNMIKDYNVSLIAIGNGTASRETEAFIIDVLKDFKDKAFYAIVSEAGASVYSASDLAIEEFPEYSVEERSAVSIARRLQDPLAELVKIDPKSIGVGQYQHDVAQAKLSDSLDFVVSTAVNQVGVDVNTASKSLLGYVSGVNKGIAENIIKYRNECGGFKSRAEIKKVPKMGPKAYEQAIGFLRITNGSNPLDQTSIHPESYNIANSLLKELNINQDELGKLSAKEKINSINKDELAKKYNTDIYTISDILDAFIAPLRDPRDELDKPLLRSDALTIEELKVGQELMGVVRNVVDFGAFVDCGVHEDGLVHISKMSKTKIKHPTDILNVGDVVKVWVYEVDLKRHKVALTMVKEKLNERN